MRFLGMTIERAAGKNNAPLEAKTKQPATLILAVAEHMKNHSTWALKILHVNKDTRFFAYPPKKYVPRILQLGQRHFADLICPGL